MILFIFCIFAILEIWFSKDNEFIKSYLANLFSSMKHVMLLHLSVATVKLSVLCSLQYEKIMKFIATAKSEGATVSCGGGRPDVMILASLLICNNLCFLIYDINNFWSILLNI